MSVAIPIAIVHGSHLLVKSPTGFGIALGFLHQLFSACFIELYEHLITGLVISILGNWDARFLGLNDERILSLRRQTRVITIHRPMTGLYGKFLLLESLCHVV